MKKQTKQIKRIPYLDYQCLPGERVQWENIKKEKFEGKLIIIDENCLATIELDNGTTVDVQC
jgi:hypothetical protein